MKLLQELNADPKISLSQLEKSLKVRFRQSDRLGYINKYLDQEENLIDVIPPYYFQNRYPEHNHENGECLACEINRQKLLIPQLKRNFLKSNRNPPIQFNKTRIISSHRCQNLSQNRCQISNPLPSLDFIKIQKQLQQKMRTVSVQAREKFKKQCGVECDAAKVCAMVVEYMMKLYESQKGAVSQSDLLNTMNIKEILTDKNLQRIVKVAFSSSKATKQQKKKLQFKKKKKQKISAKQNLAHFSKNKAKKGKHFFDDPLKDEDFQEELQNFVNENIELFRRQIDKLEQVIKQEIEKNPKLKSKVEKHIEKAMTVIKSHVLRKMKKLNEGKGEAVEEVSNEGRSVEKKQEEELKANTIRSFRKAIIKSLKREKTLVNSSDSDEENGSYLRPTEQSIANNLEKSQKYVGVDPKLSTNILLKQNGQDDVDNPAESKRRKISEKKSEKMFRRNSGRRSHLNTEQKNQSIDANVNAMMNQVEADEKVNIKPNFNEGRPQYLLMPAALKKNQVRLSTLGASKFKQQMENKAIEKKVENKKVMARKKAAEHLELHKQFIGSAQESLKRMRLQYFIIQNYDCILTKKKKIRILREMIRKRKASQSIGSFIDELIEYLMIHQENCKLLLGSNSKGNFIKQTITEKLSDNLLVQAHDVRKDLVFIDLNRNYLYGEANENDIAFEMHENLRGLVEEPVETKAAPTFNEKVSNENNDTHSQTVSDLIQTNLSPRGALQLISRSRSQKAYFRPSDNIHTKKQAVCQRVNTLSSVYELLSRRREYRFQEKSREKQVLQKLTFIKRPI